MADIYENAFVTIAATCAANSDEGLRPFRDRFKALRLGSSNSFVREWVSDRSREYRPGPNRLWPLLSRAWAFQESQLAPRTLRFSCYEVIWDCRTTRVEDKRQEVRHDLGDDVIDLLPFFSPTETLPWSGSKSAWPNTVDQYSSLDLTYRTDTLPAIAALAQRMARLRHNDAYLAGMWRSTLLSDIQWRAKEFYPRQESALPTWSWVTTQGVYYVVDQHTLPTVEILSLDYTPVGRTEIGAIKDAVLTIQGPTLPLWVHALDRCELIITHQDASWSEWGIEFVRDYKPSGDFYVDGSKAFLAFFICSDKSQIEGLVLHQVGTVYERVGWFRVGDWYLEGKRIKEDLMEHLARVPLTTVRII
jgi:hypothetical protein